MELVINSENYLDHDLYPREKARGLVPRDPSVRHSSLAPRHAVTMPLIPRFEWSARIKEKEQTKSRLSDLRLSGNNGRPIPSLDQGQVGYCWAHSSTHAVTMVRCANNLPYVPLSAYAVAATIKRGADEGGWGALSLDFITERGVPSQAVWPQGDRNYRQYDRPEVWASAALHKVTEGWVDLAEGPYDRNLTFDQVVTLLLLNVPVVLDFNWWSHSVCGLDAVEVEPGSFGVRIWNSWGDSWSDRGMGILQGSKAVPDGAVAPRVTTASVS